MLSAVDRIEQVVIIFAVRMELGKVCIKMRYHFCRKRIISGLVTFSMKPDLNAVPIADDVAKCHADQFLDPAPCFIGMDHKILVPPAIPRRGVGGGKDSFKLFLGQVFQLRIGFALKAANGFHFQVEC